MKQTLQFREYAIPACLLACMLSGCSTVDSSTYTRGAIQSGMPLRLQREAFGFEYPVNPRLGTVKVCGFTETRFDNPPVRHNLGLALLPIVCLATYWDRADWMLWESNEGAYKPVGLDMAEAIACELRSSGTFGRVLGPAEAGAFDFVLEGDVRKFILKLRPHLCGVSISLAPFVGVLGIPLGNWSLEQKVDLRLRLASDGRVVWREVIETGASGSMSAYSGGNPMQFGYPYPACMEPVVKELVAKLPSIIAVSNGSSPTVPSGAVSQSVGEKNP